MLLESQTCLKSDTPTIFNRFFDQNCEYLIPFQSVLEAIAAEEESLQDNFDASRPESSILLSKFAMQCKISLDSIDHSIYKIRKSNADTVNICFAQSELIAQSFYEAGLHDVKLSLVALSLCVAVLSLTIGFNLIFAILFMMCVLFSLLMSASVLALIGYSSFSAFNILAMFVITELEQTPSSSSFQLGREKSKSRTVTEAMFLMSQQRSNLHLSFYSEPTSGWLVHCT